MLGDMASFWMCRCSQTVGLESCLYAVDNAYPISPRISPAACLQRAREKGSESNREGINGTKMESKALPDTEKCDGSMIDVFNA
jgi:hypothetical protein